jgi:serine protease Do
MTTMNRLLKALPAPTLKKRAAIWLPFFVCAGLVASSPATAEREVPQSMQQVQLSYASVVKKAAPAVVNIYARTVVRTQGYPSLFSNDFFSRFFGNIMPSQPRERVQNSLGSGVVVRADGIIVTNSHVIHGAQQIVVALPDKRELEAEVVVDDDRADLAVLRVKTKDPLPYLEFADSDQVEVGDIILAIGNPFGVGQTVTSGIISATARTHVDDAKYQFFLQTDAAINPGNSGGAMVDITGRLLGINTAIYSRDGGSQGIGFAIPANMVKAVVASALSEGKVVHPWLGVSVQDVTSDLAESLGLDRPMGVMVNTVHPASSFNKAGLKSGDLILAVDGHEVDDQGALMFRFATKQVGKTAQVGILHNGKERTIKVALIAAPENPPRDEKVIAGSNPFSGATVGNLNPAYAEELGVDDTLTGVIVSAVGGRSYARQLGLQPGDVIVSINGQDIKRVSDLDDALDEGGRQWTIRINRGGQVRSVTVQL